MLSAEDRLYVSTVAVRGSRDYDAVFSRLRSLGMNRIEISAPHPFMSVDDLIAMLEGWRREGLEFLPHNYFPAPRESFVLNAASADPAVVAPTQMLIRGAIRIGSAVGAPFYAYHAGYYFDASLGDDDMFAFDESTFGGTTQTLARAAATARRAAGLLGEHPMRCGVLIENLFPTRLDRTHSLACTPDDLDAFFAEVGDDRVGLLLDLAHLRVTCTILELDADRALDRILERHGSRIRALHLSDNDGRRDSHDPIDPSGWVASATARAASLPGRNGNGVFATLESRRLDDEVLRAQVDFLIDVLDRAG